MAYAEAVIETIHALTEQLVQSERDRAALHRLADDPDWTVQQGIAAQLGQLAEDFAGLVQTRDDGYFLCVAAKAGKPERDSVRVAQALAEQLPARNWSCYLLAENDRRELHGKPAHTIANICLTLLALCPKHLELRARRKLAPGHNYYRDAGRTAFRREGHEHLARDFDFWVAYLQTELRSN